MSFFRRIAREPLTHFLLIGALLFGGLTVVKSLRRPVVRLEAQDLNQLASYWEIPMQRPPNKVELAGITRDPTAEELMAVVVRIRNQHGLSAMGALAVVASPEQAHTLARVLGAAAVADRPLKVFDELKAARRWFEAQLPARA